MPEPSSTPLCSWKLVSVWLKRSGSSAPGASAIAGSWITKLAIWSSHRSEGGYRGPGRELALPAKLLLVVHLAGGGGSSRTGRGG